MKRKTGFILLLLLILIYIPHLKAEENTINVEKFRKKLEEVNSYSSADKNVKKAYVETFSNRYVITPGDTLNISVLGESELNRNEVLVKCDGYINVHPIGEVKVAGFNIDEVREILAGRLSTYFVDPVVTVNIDRAHVPKIYIYGAVQEPGLYHHRYEAGAHSDAGTPPTIASVIANAGGIDYDADLENVQVIDRETGQKRRYNLLKLIKSGDPSQDAYLSSGDTVFIPTKPHGIQLSDNDFLLVSGSSIAPDEFPVRVRGAVQKPGVHLLNTRSPGLNTALAASQGFTFNAKTDAVKIHRLTPTGSLSTIIADPSKYDIVLRPNDIIDVYDKRTSLTGKSFDFCKNTFGTAGGFGSAFNQIYFMFDPVREHDINLK